MTTPAGHRAAADLRALREQWGDLLAAIGRRPAPEWPPRRTQDRAVDGETADREPTVGRLPLTLREHPAPVNLDALDAAVAIEQALFAACDAIAVRVQRPVTLTWSGPVLGPGGKAVPAPDDHDDPARWHLPTHRSATLVRGGGIAGAGSRAHGLHWAAVWLEGRALSESGGRDGDLFAPTPAAVVEDLADVAARALHRLEAALGRDGRTTDLADPCPYCGDPLTARTRTGDPHAAVIRCTRGDACPAPVPLAGGRRQWAGADLATLWGAMDARRRAAAA
ncbi:hypothetical protein [Streptomyces sp. NPDC002644]